MTGGEFERLVKLDRLPAGPLTIVASEAERAALARRFSLPSLASLGATVTLTPRGEAIEARGRLEAAFEQQCAIANEPFAARIDEPLAIRFVPRLAVPDAEEDIEFAGDEPDEIEYQGAAFDLGEAVAQSFGLALDPYATGPRAEEVRRDAGLADETAPGGPFVALAALRKDP